MEFDAPNISEKYVIEEKNLFPVGIKILQPNLLLDESSFEKIEWVLVPFLFVHLFRLYFLNTTSNLIKSSL